MKLTRILVKAEARGYGVVCGSGLLRHAHRELAGLGNFSSVHVLSSPRVWRAVGSRVKAGFGFLGTPISRSARGKSGNTEIGVPRVHLFDDAERAKNLRTVESVARALVRSGG